MIKNYERLYGDKLLNSELVGTFVYIDKIEAVDNVVKSITFTKKGVEHSLTADYSGIQINREPIVTVEKWRVFNDDYSIDAYFNSESEADNFVDALSHLNISLNKIKDSYTIAKREEELENPVTVSLNKTGNHECTF